MSSSVIRTGLDRCPTTIGTSGARSPVRGSSTPAVGSASPAFSARSLGAAPTGLASGCDWRGGGRSWSTSSADELPIDLASLRGPTGRKADRVAAHAVADLQLQHPCRAAGVRDEFVGPGMINVQLGIPAPDGDGTVAVEHRPYGTGLVRAFIHTGHILALR